MVELFCSVELTTLLMGDSRERGGRPRPPLPDIVEAFLDGGYTHFQPVVLFLSDLKEKMEALKKAEEEVMKMVKNWKKEGSDDEPERVGEILFNITDPKLQQYALLLTQDNEVVLHEKHHSLMYLGQPYPLMACGEDGQAVARLRRFVEQKNLFYYHTGEGGVDVSKDVYFFVAFVVLFLFLSFILLILLIYFSPIPPLEKKKKKTSTLMCDSRNEK